MSSHPYQGRILPLIFAEKESDRCEHLPKMVDYLVVDLKCRLKVVMIKIVQVIDLIEDQFCVTAGPC